MPQFALLAVPVNSNYFVQRLVVGAQIPSTITVENVVKNSSIQLISAKF